MRSFLYTFLFATSMDCLADKLEHIAVGLVISSRGVTLAQILQISKEWDVCGPMLIDFILLRGNQ